MEVKHLGNTDFDSIIACFLKSFENYFVAMPTDHNYYRDGWKAAGVRYDLSYGMFDGNELIGFIINAIDRRQGELIAYNSGTGVIPEYRGRRIVRTIYEYAIPELIKNGIIKCQLEVITENEKAIKSYESISFKICKHYKCFKGDILPNTQQEFRLEKVKGKAFDWSLMPNNELYSWDNQKESLIKGRFDYYQVFVKNKKQSYFIMYSESGYVAQFETLLDTPKKWNILFSAIRSVNPEARINNIDTRLSEKIEAVKSAGLENAVDQYEMELYPNINS